ncbi:3-hydroxyacyl-CoA dehydrogenase family protein [Chitinophaga pollutisoli]|uniref:3-hydroxyacyl-CoA dehydrogenase family protein n=1 Tax=Chitinophaga pollutisoli TaxID=3133966 RepID=A0ABZ2YQK7_9BACT
MEMQLNPAAIPVGVVGLGLMGSSIVASLLMSGHYVVGIAPLPEDMEAGPRRIREQLVQCAAAGLLVEPVDACLSRLTVTDRYSALRDCRLLQECVVEKVDIKKQVYRKIAAVAALDAVITSNTSAIPISTLQQLVPAPERFLGLHWAEPAYATRFLEITCGDQTAPEHADWLFRLAHGWGKEPTLLRKDIRGFITNRLMYAVYREMLHLVEKGLVTAEDADKAFRYDAGSWMTLMGIFRRMDYTGLEDAAAIFKSWFPRLSNHTGVPLIMRRMVREQARGIHDGNGFYAYTPQDARRWEAAFAGFNHDIHRLARLYPYNPVAPVNV